MPEKQELLDFILAGGLNDEEQTHVEPRKISWRTHMIPSDNFFLFVYEYGLLEGMINSIDNHCNPDYTRQLKSVFGKVLESFENSIISFSSQGNGKLLAMLNSENRKSTFSFAGKENSKAQSMIDNLRGRESDFE